MRNFITYPHPPVSEDQPIPSFELCVNYKDYIWECEITGTCEEYTGTFEIDRFTNAVHIGWYDIPESSELWEEVEFELRTLINQK